jgi:glycerol-3-phosphate acyltransferase PlsY
VLFDVGKGVAAVLVARQFSADDRLAAMAMVGVVAGHIWPVQLRFHGGKGMATALGALLAYDPRLVLAFLVLFFCLFIVWRRTLLPGLFALAGVPLAAMLHHDNSSKVVFLSILAGLVMVAHRKNLVEEILHLPARRDLDPNPDQSEL